MAKRAPGRILRWQATAILTLFFFAVAGAAAIGWWYARELPAYQGPIVLISVDGPLPSVAPPTDRVDPEEPLVEHESAIHALASGAVSFERAYTHSPLTLPANASLLSGRLPFEHGVRDDAGYALDPDVRTLAQLLRNRGFKTGAAVSSFLLRRSTGVAKGFSAYSERADESIAPELYLLPVSMHPPYLNREGVDRLEAALDSAAHQAGLTAVDEAERWARTQEGQRYFLFIEVGQGQAEEAVARVSTLLRSRELYDRATIVLVSARGTEGAGNVLDEQALRVPLLVKLPHGEGAGRHVTVPVQHIDLVPTILDLVRAPIPGELMGRSLRSLLTDEGARVDSQAIYSESLAGYLRFGGQPLFALTLNDSRYVRGMTERIERIEAAGEPLETAATSGRADVDPAGQQTIDSESPEVLKPLRATLDRLLTGHRMSPPAPVPEVDRERLAVAAGYLGGLTPVPGVADLHLKDTSAQQPLAEAHHRAARLAGQRRLPAAIYALQRMLRQQPDAATVQYQIGLFSAMLGRTQDAIAAFESAAALRPDAPEVPRALATALLASGRGDDAQDAAELAVALARPAGSEALSMAHQVAARVALARNDRDLALTHADEAQAANPAVPMRSFVEGQLFIQAGQYEAAARLLQDAAAMLKQHGTSLEGLYAGLAAALSGLNRTADAEHAALEELRAFPQSLSAYATLARAADAAQDGDKVESLVEQLLAAAPTPDGYATAIRLWKEFGRPGRAEALRSDARGRFRVDPLLARIPARDGRQ